MAFNKKNISFNRVAPIYDALAFLVFGRVLQKAQAKYLPDIPPNSQVLIIGGGTGWIATALMKVARPAHILYLEISEKMLASAEIRWNQHYPDKSHCITFICASEQYLIGESYTFDAIITPFVLDVYPLKSLEKMGQLLESSLSEGGIWLFTDFHIPPFPQKLLAIPLIQLMYLFFQWTTDIPANKLPSFDTFFQTLNMKQEAKSLYYAKCVQAIRYRKR